MAYARPPLAARLTLALAPLLALAGPPATAQDSKRIGNSLGLAALWENGLYRGVDASVDAYPFATWRAGRFFLRGPGLGVELWSDPAWKVDVFANWRFDGYEADDSDYLAGMEDRRETLDAGFAIERELGDYGRLNLSAATDTLGRHEGQELELQWSYRVRFVEASLRARWQSDALVDYYYGVEPSEALPGRPAYAPGSGLTWSVGLFTAMPIGKHWLGFVGANLDLLPDSIRDSPIVDASTRTRVFGALAWRFD